MLIRQTEAKLGTGIIELAESVEKERPAEGMILNIGPKVTDFKIGDYVAFGKYAGQLFKLNGEDLLLAKEDEMLGTIEDEINLDSGVDVGVCCSEFGINGGK
jgi:chaperonin GroES